MINDLSQTAHCLKAVADPLRLSILRVVATRPYGVVELAEIFDVAQPSISHHLKKLSAAGWLISRREGNSIYYRRPPIDADPIRRSLIEHIDRMPLEDNLARALSIADAQRTERSTTFFEQQREAVIKQTELIGTFAEYADVIGMQLGQGDAALEIGPGLGECLPMLCERYASVTAVDLSKTMVEACEELVAQQNLTVSLIEGDAATTLSNSGDFDLAVANMVLHHVPQPEAFIKAVASHLKLGGHWVICDLCDHQQQWALEACGDLWLGFDEEQIKHWASSAGLVREQRDCIALNNGFNIFVHRYRFDG